MFFMFEQQQNLRGLKEGKDVVGSFHFFTIIHRGF
jgi:hypothetical protein